MVLDVVEESLLWICGRTQPEAGTSGRVQRDTTLSHVGREGKERERA